MWKRILFLTLGLTIGGGAGFLGSQYLCSSESKSSKSLSKNSSMRKSVSPKSNGNKASASKSKKKNAKVSSKKKSRSDYQKVNHKKSKKKKRSHHRAELSDGDDASMLASTDIMTLPDEVSTPWINELSGDSAKLSMETSLKKEEGCSDSRCYGDRDRSIALVGVVVETNDLSPRNQATLVKGDIGTGDGQSRPAVYIR